LQRRLRRVAAEIRVVVFGNVFRDELAKPAKTREAGFSLTMIISYIMGPFSYWGLNWPRIIDGKELKALL